MDVSEVRDMIAAALAREGEAPGFPARWLWHLALSVDGLARGRPLGWRDGANCLLWCSLLLAGGSGAGPRARKAAAAARRLVAGLCGGGGGPAAEGAAPGALQKQGSVPQTPPPGGAPPPGEAQRAVKAVARAAVQFLGAVADLEARAGGRAPGAAAVAAAFAARAAEPGGAWGAAEEEEGLPSSAFACAFAVEAATGWRRALQELAGLALRIPPGGREAGGDPPRALAVAEAALRAAGDEAGGLWAAALGKI